MLVQAHLMTSSYEGKKHWRREGEHSTSNTIHHSMNYATLDHEQQIAKMKLNNWAYYLVPVIQSTMYHKLDHSYERILFSISTFFSVHLNDAMYLKFPSVLYHCSFQKPDKCGIGNEMKSNQVSNRCIEHLIWEILFCLETPCNTIFQQKKKAERQKLALLQH